MEKTKKRANKNSILPLLEFDRIDPKSSEKKPKFKKPDPIVKKEKPLKVKLVEEKCVYCGELLSDSINGTRFSFSCGHIFHCECYELLRISFKGSMCPICYGDERFSQILSLNEKSGQSEEMCDIDHCFGMISIEMYYDSRRKNVFGSIHDQIPFSTLTELTNPDLSLYRNFDSTDRVEIGKRSTHAMSNLITTEKCQKIRKIFQRQTPVADIVKMKYKREDFIMAGIRMDFLISHRYFLQDIYNLGFRTFSDLLTLNFQNHMLSLFNEENKAYVSIQILVDYYYVDYVILINTFADYYANHVKRDEITFQRAVGDFCRLELSKKELLKLKLTNINLFFQQFGKNCLNAECIVNLCAGDGVNRLNVLQNTFKFYGKTFENIKGFTHQHFVQLAWADDHPFKVTILSKMKKDHYHNRESSDSSLPSVVVGEKNPEDSNEESEEPEESSGSEASDDPDDSDSPDERVSAAQMKLKQMQKSAFDFSDNRISSRGSNYEYPDRIPIASSSGPSELKSSPVILPSPPQTQMPPAPAKIVRRNLLGV